ncbi:PLD nuclease N-terminal domain-containing protein [Corynebacterium aquatimens]|uniref:Cardiolipin synthase N-terminal domain-containing protein n=1 Tax=Corynebacterium aquatimens TaxID=1190508 RepID=A0A931E068_9CORY|nr:PLD nuclease N-terminal domain-containing protein [Corynebacterium aquatimens]MBG6121180.1 hypothetical protein [Corynebacterium aquatimens]WJY66266.1 hypothetical protein CAQUA_07860 [Corynebacterium aquatimens]
MINALPASTQILASNQIMALSDSDAAFLGLGFSFFILVMVLLIASFVFLIWGMIDVATKSNMDSNSKMLWIILIWFTSGIAGAIWIFWGRKHPEKWAPQHPPYQQGYYAPGAYPPAPNGQYPQAPYPQGQNPQNPYQQGSNPQAPCPQDQNLQNPYQQAPYQQGGYGQQPPQA